MCHVYVWRDGFPYLLEEKKWGKTIWRKENKILPVYLDAFQYCKEKKKNLLR